MLYFEKSQPAPECLENEKLKTRGDYKCGCVLERLKADFKNKCYICESKAPLSINVEHFKPHLNFKHKDLAFDWNNLFWSCAHCNNIKLAKFTNLLDCTNLNDEIETKLEYLFTPLPYELVKIETIYSDAKTLETKTLLLNVFNGTTHLKTIESDNIRSELAKEIRSFQKSLVKYFDDRNSKKDKNKYLRRIKNHLHIASAFTSFKRQTIKDNEKYVQEFGHYLS